MNTKSYIFAGIIAVITMGNAMATDENTVTSKSYVDAQDALKQNLIDTDMVSIEVDKNVFVDVPALVSYDDTNGLTGDTIGLLQSNTYGLYDDNDQNTWWWAQSSDSTVPTTRAVRDLHSNLMVLKQDKIPSRGYGLYGVKYNENSSSDTHSWLNTNVKGYSLVTKTSTDGRVGERKIFEASDVSGYHAQGLTQNEKDIQDISIPTVGAMMSAISAGVSAAAPTGTANTIANYDGKGYLGSGIATYDGSGTYTAQNDAGKIATAAAVETKQNKIPATGTNASTPGDTVVTYTSTAGTIGERGIYDGTGTMGSDDLITAGAVDSQITTVNNSITNMGNSITNMGNNITNINNQMNAETRESIGVPSLTCANQDCTLYQVTTNAGIAHKLYSCTAQTVATDCPACGTGTLKACENNICTCNACNGYNISASSASQCCSGYLISRNKCGCSTNAECTAYRIASDAALPSGYVDVCKSDHTCGTMPTE